MSLYIVDFSVLLSGFTSIIGAFMQSNGFSAGMFYAGAGLACIGLAILLFFGFNQITKGMLSLSKKIALGIKKMFVGGK